MFERFTERARQAVVLAGDEARALKHNYLGTEHILLGLLREDEGIAARVLASFGITAEEVRAWVARVVGEGDEVGAGQIPFTPSAKKALELSLREALSLGHNHVGTEHILIGVARVNDAVGAQVLLEYGADAEKIRDEVIRLMSGPGRTTVRHFERPQFSFSAMAQPEYAVKTLEGGSDTWAEQLATWRQDGWELLSVVTEGEERRAILERRL
jgi:ATP-dependent Clp protease ATP-binding subunit ClpC